jgi:hypothetical protein
VNIHEWHTEGLRPPFATVEQWIDEQLGYLNAEDEAVYAISLRDEGERGGLAVRILIASDRGLFDITWERPEDVAGRHVTSRHYLWSDVRGLHISGTTNLDPQTLMRTEPAWRLEIAEPAVDIECAESQAALEFWSACEKSLKKVRGG